MSEEAKRKASPGMVVQISPEWCTTFRGCFAYVTRVSPWGIEASVLVPGTSGPQVAPVRVPYTHFAVIGSAFWALDDGDEWGAPDDQP